MKVSEPPALPVGPREVARAGTRLYVIDAYGRVFVLTPLAGATQGALRRFRAALREVAA